MGHKLNWSVERASNAVRYSCTCGWSKAPYTRLGVAEHVADRWLKPVVPWTGVVDEGMSMTAPTGWTSMSTSINWTLVLPTYLDATSGSSMRSG